MSATLRLYALRNTRTDAWDLVGNDAGGLHEVWAYDSEDAAEDARQNMIEVDEWRVIELEARNA